MALALAGDRRYREHRTMAALPMYEELIVTGAWWDFVDEVAAGMLGELLDRDGRGARRRAAQLGRRRRHVAAARGDRQPRCGARRDTDVALLYDCIEPNRAGSRVLHPQGHRLGAALVRVGRPRRDRALLRDARAEPLSRREALRNGEGSRRPVRFAVVNMQ